MADVNMADPLLGCMGQETSTLTPAPTVDLTGLNLNNVQLDLPSLGTPAPTFPMEPSSVEISLEADIRLGGIPLPEIIGEVKVHYARTHPPLRPLLQPLLPILCPILLHDDA